MVVKQQEAEVLPEGVRVIKDIEEFPLVISLRAEIERIKGEAFARVTHEQKMIAERDNLHTQERLEWQKKVLDLQSRVVALQDRLLAIRAQANESI